MKSTVVLTEENKKILDFQEAAPLKTRLQCCVLKSKSDGYELRPYSQSTSCWNSGEFRTGRTTEEGLIDLNGPVHCQCKNNQQAIFRALMPDTPVVPAQKMPTSHHCPVGLHPMDNLALLYTV